MLLYALRERKRLHSNATPQLDHVKFASHRIGKAASQLEQPT